MGEMTKQNIERLEDEIWAELKEDITRASIAGKIADCQRHYRLDDSELAQLLHCGISTVRHARKGRGGLNKLHARRLDELHGAIPQEKTT
jgi:hypothetical protein